MQRGTNPLVRGDVIDRLRLISQCTQPTRAVRDTRTVTLTRRALIVLVSTTLVVLMVVVSGRARVSRATEMHRLAMIARVMRATEHSGTRQARDLERNQ